MNIEELANKIFTKYPHGSFIPKQWMHEQFGYDFKTAKVSSDHMPYAAEMGALKQQLLVLNRVLEPKEEGWEVLKPNAHAAYAGKLLRRSMRRGIREAFDILNAADNKKLTPIERKELQDERNFTATVRDMVEKAFSRRDAFAALEEKKATQDSDA